MLPYLTALSSIVPSLLLLWYFHSRDVYPEPPRVLWTTFGLGVLITLPVLVVALPLTIGLETLLAGNPFLLGLAKAFLTAAIPEEFFKLLVLLLFCVPHREFDEPMDGVVYGVAASLGFATLENILYVMNGGLSLAVMRALTAVPGHAFLGGIMGYYVGQAKFCPVGKKTTLTLAYFVPMMLHGLYDFPLLSVTAMEQAGQSPPTGLYILVALCVLATELILSIKLAGRLRNDQLAYQARRAVGLLDVVEDAVVRRGIGRLEPLVIPSAESAERGGEHRLLKGWVCTLLGGLTATCGAVLTLGLALVLCFDPTATDDLREVLLGGSLLGLLPLVLGIFLFNMGLRELNRESPPPAPRSRQAPG